MAKPTGKWQTDGGSWMFPCAGGCGEILKRPAGTRMKSWRCDNCATGKRPVRYIVAPRRKIK